MHKKRNHKSDTEVHMWRILITEFNYNKILFLVLFGLVPIIAYMAVYPPLEDMPATMLLFCVMLMPIQNWIIFRNRENRDRGHALLPVSVVLRALERMGLIVILCAAMITTYCFIQFIVNPARPVAFMGAVVAFGIILIIFSIYFILRDLLLFVLRNNRLFKLSKERSKTVLIFLVLILNLLGIYYFLIGLDGRMESSGLIRMIRFIKYDPLFTTGSGIIQFMSGCLLFAGLTILTSAGRKSYIE